MNPADTPAQHADTRVFYKDVVPYDAPERLDDLQGPADGILRLPRHVYWGPEAEFDLSEVGNVITVYQATVRVGTDKDQVRFLNRELLMRIWPELVLPARCRDLWESRFPELVGG